MIVNPVVYGGERKERNISFVLLADGNYGFPSSAVAGDYVVSTSGNISQVLSVRTASYDSTYVILDSIPTWPNIESIPPLAREKLENVPQTYAPPTSNPGYYAFVMPDEDVKIIALD